MIDADGKLTVEGTGDFAPPSDNNALNDKRAPWYTKRIEIKTAEINVQGMTDASYMFDAHTNLTSVDFRNFDTSKVKNMADMFYLCKNLESLDLSSFNTGNVAEMSGMFSGCKKLTSLDLSGFNTENVTNMSSMFSSCGGLTSLDLSNFNTRNVTNMSGMFSFCEGLTSLDLSSFNTGNVAEMSGMFSGCKKLTSLDLSGFNTENVTNMSSMFSSCSSLTSLDLSSFNTENVTNMSGMFRLCSKLESLDLINFNTRNVTYMGNMFSVCSSLTSLNISQFDTSNVENMSSMFSNCNKLESLDLSSFNTENVTNMQEIFGFCSNLTILNLNSFNTGNVTNMQGMFGYCSSLTSLDLSSFDTGNVTNMKYMFDSCKELTSLDVSSFDTRSTTCMWSMFIGCSGLKDLDVTHFDTRSVTEMEYMFKDCSGLTSLDLSSFNTGNVTSMEEMFRGCSSLETLDVSSFTADKVEYAQSMFLGCTNLTSLDLNSFDAPNVRFMDSMFKDCQSLTSLDLGSLSASNVESILTMFSGCQKLETLDLSGIDAFNITSYDKINIFEGCDSLTTIYTPRNIKISISLPVVSSTSKWYRSDGTVVTQMPQNLEDSVALGRDSTPVEKGEQIELISVTVENAQTSRSRGASPNYQSKNLLLNVFYIHVGQGKINLNCRAKHKWEVKEYTLYAGNAKIAVSQDGIFRNLDPKILENDNLRVSTKGKESINTETIYLKVIDLPLIPKSFEIGGGDVSFELDEKIPILGGSTHAVSLRNELPVSLEYESGKIKVGFNIKEKELGKHNWRKEIEKILRVNSFNHPQEYTEIPAFRAEIPCVGSIKVEMLGYAEAAFPNSTNPKKLLSDINGTLILKLTGEIEGTVNAVIVVVPITIKGTFTAEGSLEATIGYDFENAKWYGDLELAASISIKAFGGIGTSFLCVGGYGSAETGLTIILLSKPKEQEGKKPGLSEWYLCGEAGLEAHFACWEGSIPLISTEYLNIFFPQFMDTDDGSHLLLYSREKNSVISRKNTRDTAGYTDISANVLGAPYSNQYWDELSEWSDCNEAVALTAENSDNVLITNAFAAATPRIATVGNATVLLYIDNDTSRATPNQTVLKYRIYDDASKSWGPAATACEDGTADFNPVIYSNGTELYVAYQNSTVTYAEGDDPDIEAYAGSFGISALRYDASTQKFVDLGKVNRSRCYCYTPQLAMTDKGLCVAWVENTDNSLLGLTTNNRIMTSTLTDRKFSVPSTVASGLSSVTSLAIGKNGSVDSLAYAMDTDNNLTTETQEVYLAALSGAPAKCTEGNIKSLKFTSLPSVNTSVLACSADGALSYISGTTVRSLTDKHFMSGSDFIVDGNRIFYLADQDECRNVMAAVYSDGTWNTVMATTETDYIDSFAYDGKRFAYLLTEAVLNDTGDSWNTSSVIKSFESLEHSDIAVLNADFNPEAVKPGTQLPVTLTIANEGLNTRSNIGISVKKSDGSEQKLTIKEAFAPGETKECTVNLPLPGSIDASCIYTLTLDADEKETKTDNNSCQIDLSLTDCEVSAEYVLKPKSGNRKSAPTPVLEVTVSNRSYVAATGTLVVTDEEQNEIFTSGADTIGASGQKIYEIDLTSYLSKDTPSLLLTASFQTDAKEYYKSNNSDSQNVFWVESSGNKVEAIPKGIDVSTFVDCGYEYTGSAVEPALFVYNDGKLLTEGTDYTIQYDNNINVYQLQEGDDGFDTAHSPKAVVAFIGEAAGNASVTRYFKIVPRSIGGADVSCSVAESDETGTIQHPDVRLLANGTALVKDVDYTLTYPDEGSDAYLSEGTYNIYIEGKGNYYGSRYEAFTIRHKHSWDSSYSRDGEGHWQVCACEEATAKESHTFGDWTTTKEATKTESGSKERLCSVCGYKELEIIRIPDDGNPEEPSEDESSTEKPSENEGIWGDIIPEDRPDSSDKIPKGLWVAGLSDSYAYIGEAIKPVVRVYDSTTLLAEKSEYTIAYKNNTKVGEATITVKGKGDYSGKETCTFHIAPADVSSDDFYADDFYVKIDAKKAQKPIPEIYYMGAKLKNNKDFTVAYANTSGIYAQEGSYNVTVTGINNFTGTKTVTLLAVTQIPKVKPVSITKAALTGFEKSYIYSGKACKQTCTLKMQTDSGEKSLVEGADYTVRYANNVKAGTATVTYYGKNKYSGKLKKSYKILPYDILGDNAQKITYSKTLTCVFAKGGAKPKPVIQFDGKALREGTDYTLAYKNNKAANAAASVTITGKGSFKGKIAIDFTITPQDLSKMTLVSCDKVYSSKPNAYKITPKLMDLDGKLLSAGKDFDKNSLTYAYEAAVTLENGVTKQAGDTVEETDIIPADTQIRVTFGCGSGKNYTGTFSGIYRIVKADMKSAKVEIPTQIYTGAAIVPDKTQIKVTIGGTKLRDEDYDIVLCTDNVKKGKASITLKGNGNYGGTKTVKFTIGAKGFLWWWRK